MTAKKVVRASKVTVTLPEPLASAIKRDAEAAGISQAQVIVQRIKSCIDEPLEIPVGPVETKTRGDIAQIFSEHPTPNALAETAFALARVLDSGPMIASAGVAKQLIETIDALIAHGRDGDDDEFDFGIPTVGNTA